MMVRFKFSGYISNVYGDKKIKITIDEEDHHKVNYVLSKIYKQKKEYTSMNVLIQKQTEVDIQNLTYNELKDLIGVHVYIDCVTKYYSFESTEFEDTGVVYRGYSIVAISVKNYTI